MDIYNTYPLYAQHSLLVGFCKVFFLGYSWQDLQCVELENTMLQ
jgi:hypothetical protein